MSEPNAEYCINNTGCARAPLRVVEAPRRGLSSKQLTLVTLAAEDCLNGDVDEVTIRRRGSMLKVYMKHQDGVEAA